MLDEIPLKKLKTLIIPTKENSVVLFSLLKGFNGLSNNGLDLLIRSLELLVLLHGQLLLNPQVVDQSLSLLLGGVSFVHGRNKLPP